MGVGVDALSGQFLDHSLLETEDNLQWRKTVQYWTQSIIAGTLSRHYRSKGASTTLGLLLSDSLPTEKQQRVEKAANYYQLKIDLTVPASPSDKSGVFEKIMQIVAKHTATESICRMETLNKKASSCVRENF